MKNTIQLTVQQLENILLTAKQELRLNSDCANTIEIEQLKECNTHSSEKGVKLNDFTYGRFLHYFTTLLNCFKSI